MGGGREGAKAKSGKAVPMDSTPCIERPIIKPTAGRKEGQARDSRRGLPVDGSQKGSRKGG